jgi:hypothetical protein
MEEVTIDREARGVIDRIAHVFATKKPRYILVYYYARYDRMAVVRTTNMREGVKKFIKNTPKLCAGIFAKDADPEFMRMQIKAALKYGRKCGATEKSASRNRKYNPHLRVLPPDEFRARNFPLIVRLGQ